MCLHRSLSFRAVLESVEESSATWREVEAIFGRVPNKRGYVPPQSLGAFLL